MHGARLSSGAILSAGARPASRARRPGWAGLRAGRPRSGSARTAGTPAACPLPPACGRPCGRCTRAGGDQVHPGPAATPRLRHDVVARQLRVRRKRWPQYAQVIRSRRNSLALLKAGSTSNRLSRDAPCSAMIGCMSISDCRPLRDVEAAAQRGQRAVAVDPRHRARRHVEGRLLERDPRLGRALDVELQHVAVSQVRCMGGLLSSGRGGMNGWVERPGGLEPPASTFGGSRSCR
jgi:hypothetical protein